MPSHCNSTCRQCEKSFVARPHNTGEFCSRSCLSEHRKSKVYSCPGCDIQFFAGSQGVGQYCSYRCYRLVKRSGVVVASAAPQDPMRADLSGMQFGRLKVVSISHRGKSRRYWLCICDCGQECVRLSTSLRKGSSCGCNPKEIASNKARRPRQHPEYAVWATMIQRCTNPKATYYNRYGGRGITVCDEWRNFERFFADMGSRPDDTYSIERLDNNGPYAPWNCKWGTKAEQTANREPHELQLTHEGVTLNVRLWAERIGIKQCTLRYRLRKGWPIERVLSPI